MNSKNGIGLATLLTVLFVAFKLAGIIHWSWWWVISPLWINALLLALCFALPFIVVGAAFVVLWIVALFRK